MTVQYGSRPVAENCIGLPWTPEADAVNVLAPALAPSVQLPTRAIPLASVVGAGPVMLPPPLATLNVTVIPATGLLPASRTITAGSVGTVELMRAVWLSPAYGVIARVGAGPVGLP